MREGSVFFFFVGLGKSLGMGVLGATAFWVYGMSKSTEMGNKTWSSGELHIVQ